MTASLGGTEGMPDPNTIEVRDRIDKAYRENAPGLDLSGLKLTSLPSEIGLLANLERLVLNDNLLEELPTEIGGLAALRRLELENNRLTYLPREIGQLVHLDRLNLSRNRLADLPSEIGHLAALRHLHLGYNLLAALPVEIGRLSNLKELRLAHNKLHTLPAEIGRLIALTRLDIEQNKLQTVPNEICSLSALTSLDIDNNLLTSLPADIGQLSNLESLHVSHNKLSAVPAELSQLVRLHGLHVADNLLENLPIDIGRMTRLGNLDLGRNQLDVLPVSISQLKSLYRLNLSNNRLTVLPAEIGDLLLLASQADPSGMPYSGGLYIEGNPLSPPYPKLIGIGQPEATQRVLAWLRGEYDPSAIDSDAPEIPPPLPQQGVGPHFVIDGEGRIAPAPPDDLDREGNNLRLLRQLHPLLRALACDLLADLPGGNLPHPRLRDRAEAYREQIDRDLSEVTFAVLYGHGVRLANAAAAAEREIASGEQPPLTEAVREELDSLLQLHGTFILATADGMLAVAAEERYLRRPDEERRYRAAAVALTHELQTSPGVAQPSAVAVVGHAAEEIGQGRSPERSGAIGIATVRNMTIALATAGTIAALPLAGALALGNGGLVVGGAAALFVGESFKKSRLFVRITSRIRSTIDAASEADLAEFAQRLAPHLRFITTHEQTLRNLNMPWLNGRLDWVKRQSQDPSG